MKWEFADGDWDEDWSDDYEDTEYDDDWDDFDCGLTDTGFCWDIGSEYCEFMCPYSGLILSGATPPEDEPELPTDGGQTEDIPF